MENTSTDDKNQDIYISTGWLCPVCKRVNAPWMAVCPCYSKSIYEITCQPYENTNSLKNKK